MRVLSIGVNRYQNPKIALKFAVADAVAFNEAFRKIGAEPPAILTDAAATRAGIEQALAALTQQSTTCDTAVVFFSGWGNAAAGRFYLYPSDGAREDNFPQQGISPEVLWAWLDKIQAQNLLVILDTGDATDFLTATLMKTIGRSDDTERNLSIIAPQGNSRDDQKSEHGVLTFAVLQALTKESDLNGDGLLSVSELEAATAANVIRANAGLSAKESFRARAVSVGNDFVIGRVGGAKPVAMRGTQTYAQQNPAPRATLNGKYRALLIATNEYQEWDPLRNPISDAQAIAQELDSHYGFEKPKLLLNPTRKEMSKAISDLRTGQQFGPDDELLIFIAGHGTYDKALKTGYLVVKDSVKDDPGYDSYYSQYELFRNVAAIPVKHVLVVIDACEAGAGLAQLNRDDPKGDITYKPGAKLDGLLQRKDRRSLLWITSGGDKYVPDGEGKHSPFAYQLLSALDSGTSDPNAEGIVTFVDVLNYANRVHSPAPQPTYGWLPENDHGADFWLIANPALRVRPADRR